MKNLIIMAAALCCSFQMAAAQRVERADSKEIGAARQEMMREIAHARAEAGARADAPISTATVGEPDSFGKNAQFLGIAASGVIYIDSTCDPANVGVLGPDDKCLAVPDPTVQSTAHYTDFARITIPGKSVSNIIYMINNHTTLWDFENSTAGIVLGQMLYNPTITIESDALNDPAAIDPISHHPMNGSFTTSGNGTKSISETLFPGFTGQYIDSYSRANTVGLSRTYFAGLGLPSSVIDQLYKKPMTIRLGVNMLVRNVTRGSFLFSARFLGN
jgi:hypothetical protein